MELGTTGNAAFFATKEFRMAPACPNDIIPQISDGAFIARMSPAACFAKP